MGETRSFTGDFKRFFGRGLGILLPSIVTLWLLFQAFIFVFNNVAEPINRGIRGGVIRVIPMVFDETEMPSWFVVTEDQVSRRAGRRAAEGLAEMSRDAIRREIRVQQFRTEWSKHWYLDGLGIIVAIILIYLAGLLLGNYLGRQIYTRVEALIARIPGFKQVYPHVKQFVDLIFGEKASMKAFSEVVMVEYPRNGLWSLGFVTGHTFQQVRETAGEDTVSVFIPTSPTPMTGFVINAQRKDTVKLDISIDQALRFIITAGVLTPEHDAAPAAEPQGSSRLLKAQKAAERAIEESSGKD
ncbi:MAG: DUF502 domain-containing protein [Phycisphaeraceae bacterium]|nr:DUF502 domain-containing protein [Myxococcales bacterium]USN98458.1 MAG: DUF502 domain-containing protein [Phycisphaeraceae bacterium]